MAIPRPSTIAETHRNERRKLVQKPQQTDSVVENPIASVASGCLYAFYVVGLSAGMLFLNALFCLAVYAELPKFDDEQIQSRVGQLFFFVVPVLLLIVEWNLLDRLQRLFRRGVA